MKKEYVRVSKNLIPFGKFKLTRINFNTKYS